MSLAPILILFLPFRKQSFKNY